MKKYVEILINNRNDETGIAEVIEVLCRGCGTCSNVCPSSVPFLRQFETRQIIGMIEEAVSEM